MDPETGLVWKRTLAKLVIMNGAPNSSGNRHQDGEFDGTWRLIVDLGDFLEMKADDSEPYLSAKKGAMAVDAEDSAARSGEIGERDETMSCHPRSEMSLVEGACSRQMQFYRIISGGPEKETRVMTPVFSTSSVVLAMNGRAAGSPAGPGRAPSPFVHERRGRGVSAVFDIQLSSAV